MCGICGIINFNGESVKEESIRKMMQIQKHRGPDDDGVYLDDNIGLGFVRLSILDLSLAGHQPMFSSDNRYCIIFNGEVYNYLEIRDELKDSFSFNSNSDTEVVLNSYIKWGEKCLDKFNGMFSMVIYDILEKQLFIARDRFGIKPFYYFKDDNRFIFASDIPPILSAMGQKPTADNDVILNYLLLNRTNYNENSFFKEVKKLRPGCFLKIQGNKIENRRWYNIRNELKGKGFNTPADYYNCLKDSIEIQLRSDVPVGICLSGGLDSSAIASTILKEHNHSSFHSYSAIYETGDVGDEQEYINEYIGSNMMLHSTKPSPIDLLKNLDKYIEALSEPIPGTSEYAEFKVMELAKRHSTVILNGQGADEVLGGYDYFYGLYLKELILKFKIKTFIRELIFLKKFGKLLCTLKFFVYFMSPAFLKLFMSNRRINIIDNTFYKTHKKASEIVVKNLYASKSLRDFFIRHFEYKFEHNLLWADKSGMYFSIETRFPFLDHRLIENSLACKSSQIFKDGWTKYILREGLTGILPEKIRTRKSKVGFETPENEWFRTPEFSEFINKIIDSDSFKNRIYFNLKAFRKLYSDHLNRKKNAANTIWKVIHLELWLRKYID